MCAWANERIEHRKKIANSHVIDVCMCEHARTSNKCDTKYTQLNIDSGMYGNGNEEIANFARDRSHAAMHLKCVYILA